MGVKHELAPIELPFVQIASNTWIYEVKAGADWPLGLVVTNGMHGDQGDPWRSNLVDGTKHDTSEGAFDELRKKFVDCIDRCYVKMPVETVLISYREYLTKDAEQDEAIVDLMRALDESDAQCASVNNLPWIKTQNGNYVTQGGRDFPWPFTYLVVEDAGGSWRVHDEEGDKSYPHYEVAKGRAQEIHDARISRLINGMTLAGIVRDLEDLTPDGVQDLARKILGHSGLEEILDSNPMPLGE